MKRIRLNPYHDEPQLPADADITEIVEVCGIELDEHEDEMYRRLARRDSTRTVRKMRHEKTDFSSRKKNVKTERRQARQLKEAMA